MTNSNALAQRSVGFKEAQESTLDTSGRRAGSGINNALTIFILILHVLLGAVYSVVTPLWESFDEWGHYPYVAYIGQERALPTEPLVERNDETHQPPLYYILGAAATFWVDATYDLQLVSNEHSVHRGGAGGVRLHLPREDDEFPYRGAALAGHLVRLVSVFLSSISVLATYLTARTLFPRWRELALGAMAASAFWPQLLFMGAVINNDVMVTACASLVLLFLTRTLVDRPSPLNMLGLGLALGAALWSKRNGLSLVPFVLVGLVVIAIDRRRDDRASLVLTGAALIVSIGAMMVSAWWSSGLWDTYQGYVRGLISMLLDPAQLMQLHWGRLPSGLYFCLATFFSSFGHVILGVEAWIYRLVAVICAVAGLGVLALLVSKRSDRPMRMAVLILVLHSLAVLAAPVYRTIAQSGEPAGPTVVSSIQPGPPLLFSGNVFLLQGRFVLPAVSSFSILLVLGLASLAPKRCQPKVLAAAGSILLAFSILVPFRYIRPAYARPRQLSPSEVQARNHSTRIAFGGKIELLDYEVEADDVSAGSHVPVRLYWRCLREMERDYTLEIEALGPRGEVYGALRAHPGNGNFPTSLWDEGETFGETYLVLIADDVPTPSLAYLRVSFHTAESSGDTLDARDRDGNPTSATFGQFVVRSQQEPDVEQPAYYGFDGKAALIGYRIAPSPEVESQLEITLAWEALKEIEGDYTVFVHVIDEAGELLAQHDDQPGGGRAPTSIWKEGEVIADKRVVPLTGTLGKVAFTVRLGLYDLSTMERLPVFEADGSRLPHDMVVLEYIPTSSEGAEG